jgi:hypothetical protein
MLLIYILKQSVTEIWLSNCEIGDVLMKLLHVSKIFVGLLVAVTYVFSRNESEWLHLLA